MSERHEKWVPVSPGTVIPAGQPYRIEFANVPGTAAHERTHHSEVAVWDSHEWFVDSTWKPPLDLPTEPTWGIVLNKRPDRKDGHALDFGRWAVYGDDEFAPLERTHRSEFDTRCDVLSRDGIADFIPLTDEQVARIEAAR
jgi:hypothetical protein